MQDAGRVEVGLEQSSARCGDVRAPSASLAALQERRESRVRCFVRPRVRLGFLLFNNVSCCELEY